MKNFKGLIAGFITGCMVASMAVAAFAEEQVTFLLPIDYFCVDEDQTESTQEQLDEYSKDGLKYEFTEDGQIICYVEDEEAALKAVIDEMEKDFAENQNPDSNIYIKSYQKLEYNEDLTEITITCKKEDWGFMDDFFSALYIMHSRDYQRISGIEEKDMKCVMKFLTEEGEVIYEDTIENYLDDEEEAE